MGTARFLVSAMLLVGGCESLWGIFQAPNPDFCDPATPGCGNASQDGGVDAAVADAATGSDAAQVSDMRSPGDSAGTVGDGALNPDLSCTPPTVYPWVADTTLPSAQAVALTGITGSGSGDIWTVGNSLYAAHRNKIGTWTTIGMGLGTTLGRAAYGPKQKQALVLASDLLNGSTVIHLTTTDTSTADSTGLLAGLPTGIWVSADPENLPYTVGADKSFKTYGGVSWPNVVPYSPTPVVLSDIAGSGLGATTKLWGVAAAATLFTGFDGTQWQSVSTGAYTLNAVWVSPNLGVVAVGKSGAIMTAPATLPVQSLALLAHPVTAELTDISGTADGRHLWAVGAGGTIVHWESACGTWTQETSTTTKDLSALWVSDAEKMVWAVGASGTVLHRMIP